ncbi:hypothetical protein RB201_33605 [Streptomyces sp. S1A(2023)]
MITATRLEAAAAAVTVMSNRSEVTDWAARYFGQWWNATSVEAATVCAGAVLVADVDPEAYQALTLLVHDGRHTEEVEYARHRMLVARDGEDVIATSPDEAIAYRSCPVSGRLTLTGIGVMELSLAAARLGREVIRGHLLRDGWAVLHSSAVVRPQDGATLLAFGGKGAGKTTTALLLASSGWQLLANDRVLVRPTGTRGVEVVPWPSAAAVGLGLLESLGWGAAARGHVRRGGAFHPTQHDAVTTALLAGDFTPLWEDGKRRGEEGPGVPGPVHEPVRGRAGHGWPRCGAPLPPGRRRVLARCGRRCGAGVGGRRLHERRYGGPLPRHLRAGRRCGRRWAAERSG